MPVRVIVHSEKPWYYIVEYLGTRYRMPKGKLFDFRNDTALVDIEDLTSDRITSER